MTTPTTTPPAKDSTAPDKGLLGVVCLALVRFWCRLVGHVQRWSPDDADKHCRRCGHEFYPDEEDPYQSEDYQRFLAECAKECTCSHDICDSVLAGGVCEDIHDYHDDL